MLEIVGDTTSSSSCVSSAKEFGMVVPITPILLLLRTGRCNTVPFGGHVVVDIACSGGGDPSWWLRDTIGTVNQNSPWPLAPVVAPILPPHSATRSAASAKLDSVATDLLLVLLLLLLLLTLLLPIFPLLLEVPMLDVDDVLPPRSRCLNINSIISGVAFVAFESTLKSTADVCFGDGSVNSPSSAISVTFPFADNAIAASANSSKTVINPTASPCTKNENSGTRSKESTSTSAAEECLVFPTSSAAQSSTILQTSAIWSGSPPPAAARTSPISVEEAALYASPSKCCVDCTSTCNDSTDAMLVVSRSRVGSSPTVWSA